jgi:hypothetical protein
VILDVRTYRTKPGKLPAQIALYEKHGKDAQIKHLGQPIVWATTETGEINTYVHIWAYDSVEDRAKRRAAMQADPDWQTFMKVSGEAGYLEHQENKIMIPAAFAPVKR